MAQNKLERSTRIYIAGLSGPVGSAIWGQLKNAGFRDLRGASPAEVDLRSRVDTISYLHEIGSTVMTDAAAGVGGILANEAYPAGLLSENLRIKLNLMDAES